MALRIAVHHLIDGGYQLNPRHDGYDRVGLRLAEHTCADGNQVLNDDLREVLARIGLRDRALLGAPYPLVLQAFALLVARGVGADAGTMCSPDLYAAVATGYGLRMADRWRPDVTLLSGLTRAQLHAMLTGSRLGELSERWRECREADPVGHLAKAVRRRSPGRLRPGASGRLPRAGRKLGAGRPRLSRAGRPARAGNRRLAGGGMTPYRREKEEVP